MTAYLLADHLLNLVAPAAMIALLMAVLARIFSRLFKHKLPLSQVWSTHLAINFVVGSCVLLVGLALLGRDGRMLTYVAMAVAVATSQWHQLGGWRH
ncbi:MAG: hypothetical protein JWR74_1288 [Polaromonas sp.]|jgi:hypothetical protein|nr:hypothetical protein [Polaromonas sp.]